MRIIAFALISFVLVSMVISVTIHLTYVSRAATIAWLVIVGAVGASLVCRASNDEGRSR